MKATHSLDAGTTATVPADCAATSGENAPLKLGRTTEQSPDAAETDDGSNPVDMQQREILEDRPGDSTFAELRDAVIGLNDDEKIDLIALATVAGPILLAMWTPRSSKE